MGVAEFNALFALKTRTHTPDGAGNSTVVEAVVAGYSAVPCYVQTVPVKEEVVSEKIVHVVLKNVFANVAASVVTTDHFITIDSVDYEIIDVAPTTPLKIVVEKKV